VNTKRRDSRFFSRRRMLQLAGLAPGALFLPSLLRADEAGTAAPPKRVVLLSTRHGPVNCDADEAAKSRAWEFLPPGLDHSPQAEWELPLATAEQSLFKKQLAPLYEHRNDLLILQGLAMTSAIANPPGNNHGVGEPHLFTCGTDDSGKRVSFDQYIAETVAVPGRIPYVSYSTGSSDGDWGLFDTAGNPVVTGRLAPAQYGYLEKAFDRLFGDLPGTGDPAPTGPPTPLELSRQQRNQSIEFLRARYAEMAPRMSGEDRLKLEQHHEMLADLMRYAAPDCTKPGYPPQEAMSNRQIADIVLTKLYPLGLACDLTRVASLFHGQLSAADCGAPSTLDTHQDIAHAGGSGGEASTWLETYYNVHAQQFASLVAAFKAIPEGNGTMLDNSLLIWIPELANGWHRFFQTMVVMAGGLSGAFETGRYIKYAETGPNPQTKSSESHTPLGPALNKLYVSIMQAMGVDRSSIGVTSLQGVSYGSGANVDLTGPLPRLAG
jgi:hypothetical protein